MVLHPNRPSIKRIQDSTPATSRVPDTIPPVAGEIATTLTGTWSSPETIASDEELWNEQPVLDDVIDEELVDTRPPAKFVRVMHTQVGMYPYGSVLPVSTFEYLDHLLKLGAIEYDYEATEETISGNPEHMATITGVMRAAVQTIPNAPWSTSAAHNLLGATYVSLAQTSQPWIPAPPASPASPVAPVDATIDPQPPVVLPRE